MKSKKNYKPEELHYLQLLSKQYPTVQAAGTEIVNLQAILNLPKAIKMKVTPTRRRLRLALREEKENL